jgi:hypothetical protein
VVDRHDRAVLITPFFVQIESRAAWSLAGVGRLRLPARRRRSFPRIRTRCTIYYRGLLVADHFGFLWKPLPLPSSRA